jgi:hypothetical protein
MTTTADAATSELLDRLAIRELADNWLVYRDTRDWPRFFSVWHDDGVVMTTWGGRTSPESFAEAASRGYARGDRALHANDGTAVELAGDRAIGQTKLRIMQRADVDGVECDVTCLARSYDFYERRNGRWGLVLRQLIYERDWITAVDPSSTPVLDPERLAQYPEGYARLAYLQAGLGYEIGTDMPTAAGPRLDALLDQGRIWLEGGPLTWGASD